MGVRHHCGGEGHVTQCAALVLVDHVCVASLRGQKERTNVRDNPKSSNVLFPIPSHCKWDLPQAFWLKGLFFTPPSLFPHHHNFVSYWLQPAFNEGLLPLGTYRCADSTYTKKNGAHNYGRAHCVWHHEENRMWLYPLYSLKQVKDLRSDDLHYLAEISSWHSALPFTNFSLARIHGHLFKFFFFRISLKSWTFS